MRNFWSDTEIRNRETEAMAQHLADRIHVFAFVLTLIVLGMRLIAGRQDLTPDAPGADAPGPAPAADVQTPMLY
jgi:hypothetical protein